MPLFALNNFPGVKASTLNGPNSNALIGSISPSKSSAVRSGLPCTRTNRSAPEIFLVLTLLPTQCGHWGFFGEQFHGQSFTSMLGNNCATFFASVVLPTPGDPIIRI